MALPPLVLAWAALLAPLPRGAGAGDGELERALARHPHLAKLTLRRIDAHTPYLFLVQERAGSDPLRSERTAQRLVPVLDTVLARFEQEVAVPLRREPRPGAEPFPVVVLASRGDLAAYQLATGAEEHLGTRACFDAGLGAAVLYDDPAEPTRDARERARSARHAFVHVCQAAWAARAGAAPLDSWVLEGMADSWAQPGSAVLADPEHVRALGALVLDEGLRWSAVRTLAELVAIDSPAGLEPFFAATAPALDPAAAREGFRREGALLFRFLWEVDGARRRTATREHLGRVLAGASDPAPLLAAVGGVDLLERQFLAWFRAQHELGSKRALDEALLALAFARTPDGKPAAPAPPPPDAPAPAPPPPPPLDLADATDEERLALALHALASGDAALGRDALAELARTAPEPLRERAERERRRAEAWIERRDAWLAGVAGGKEAVAFEHAGRKRRARVLAVEQGALVLDGDERERVPIGELDPLALAQGMPAGDGPDAWSRLYPYVLREDVRAAKLLRGAAGEGAALLADARDDYPARLALARALVAFEELARREPPDTPQEAREQLDELVAWTRTHAELAVAARKHDALVGRARQLLATEVALAGAHTLVRGRLEALAGGVVRVAYAFDDAAELADFDPTLYPAEVCTRLEPAATPSEPFRVEDGAAVAVGRASLRTLYELGPPLVVRWTYEHRGEIASGMNDLALGILDDGAEGFVWAFNNTHLQRIADGGATTASGPEVERYLNQADTLELRSDGRAHVLTLNGVPGPTLSAPAAPLGAVFVLSNASNPLYLTKLEIEGTLAPSSFARLVEARIAAELAALF